MRQRSNGEEVMPDKIYAPYNFVPVSAFVYQPPWGASVSRDLPYADGLNGSLAIRVEAHTPLLVGGEQVKSDGIQPGEVFPAVGFDGHPEIPGSSLKGMIRNLLSIAAFGKMDQVDDQWLSIRDLTNAAKTFYRDQMTTPKLDPRAKAGFLRPVKDQDGFSWDLTPCEFKFVDHKSLTELAVRQGIKRRVNFAKEQSAVEKYEKWGMDRLDTSFDCQKPEPGDRKPVRKKEKKAGALGHGSIPGRLVFTGQPSDGIGKGKKYHEFVFYKRQSAIPVAAGVMRKFLHVHGKTDEWKFWETKLHHDWGVPVFYLEQGGEPTDIGLALMFRLSYRNSIGGLLDRLHCHHRDPNVRDLAALLFGHISDQDRGLAGRVSFSNARLQGTRHNAPPVVTVLNGPKPSYYPAYIEQDHDEEGRLKKPIGADESGKPIYSTMMDDDAEPRGWKRYPVRPRCGGFNVAHGLGDEDNNSVRSELQPLASGAVFTGTVRVHNLRPIELGALLWCLTWGEQTHLRHAIGMGKPFGMGQVSLQVTGMSLTRNDSGTIPDLSACIRLFTEEMERAYGAAVVNAEVAHHGWAGSEQITQLTAMADPGQAPGLPGKLEYMALPDFQASKGKGKNDPRLALLPYASYDGPRDRDLFQRWTREAWDAHRQAELAAAAAAAEAAARAAALAAMTPEQRALAELEQQISEDLAGVQAVAKAAHWCKVLAQYAQNPVQADLIARFLRDYYQAHNGWSGKKLTNKQKDKVAEIKRYLLDEGAADVPQ